MGGAQGCRWTTSASALGQHELQEPRVPRRPLRGAAHRSGYGQHQASGHHRRVPRPRRNQADRGRQFPRGGRRHARPRRHGHQHVRRDRQAARGRAGELPEELRFPDRRPGEEKTATGRITTNVPFPRTKIVCTLGPASNSRDTLRSLMEAGLSIARVNFSHGTHEQHAETVAMVRETARELSRPVAIIGDLQGPRIRIGDLDAPRAVRAGQLVVAKIEKDSALENIESIVLASDAVMVARGDLGVELPFEEVPIAQKRIISLCNKLGRPVITATQMLESMITHPRPTRAEASDVANAIFDGTDAVMLSAETAAGKYPRLAVGAMTRIITEIERHPREPRDERTDPEVAVSTEQAIAAAATSPVRSLRAPALIVVTKSGLSARIIAAHRPDVPIPALTD